MSMDLDIKKYSIRDLETFFKLEADLYTPSQDKGCSSRCR